MNAVASRGVVLVALLGGCVTRSTAPGEAVDAGDESGDDTMGEAASSDDAADTEDGPLAWALRFDTDGFSSIAAAPHAGIAAVGTCFGADYGGSPLPDPEGFAVCPLVADGDGATSWAAAFQGNGAAYGPGQAIARDEAGNVYLAGTFSGTLDFGGGPVVGEIDPDIGTIDPSQTPNIYVASFDSEGEHRWSRSMGLGWGHGIAAAPDGSVFVTGSDDRAGGMFVSRLDARGAEVWTRVFEGVSDGCSDVCDRTVATDAAGNVFVFGQLSAAYDFGGGLLAGPDAYDPIAAMYCSAPIPAFVASLDGEGGHRWSRRLAPVDADGPAMCGDQIAIVSVTTTDEGDVVLTGSLAGSIDFGSGPIEAAGGTLYGMLLPEAFVARVSGEGEPRWSVPLGPTDAVDDPPAWANASRSVTVDTAGNVHVAIHAEGGTASLDDGSTFAVPGTLLVSLRPDGTRYATAGFTDVHTLSIAAGIDASLYLGGGYTGQVEVGPSHLPGPRGAFLAKLPSP